MKSQKNHHTDLFFRTDKKTLLSAGVVILLLLVLISLPRLLSQLIKQRKSFTTSAVGNPRLCLKSCTGANPATDITLVNNAYSVSVMLATDQISIRGVDVLLNFDKNLLQLTDIKTTATAVTTLKQFAPLTTSGTFDKASVLTYANSTGLIRFGATTFLWNPLPTPGVITSAYNSGTAETALAILTFLPKSAGSANVNFAFTGGSATDSNVVAANSNQDSLSTVVNLKLTISNPAISASPAVTISKSPTPTKIPTKAPTFSPSVTEKPPTPTVPSPTTRPTNPAGQVSPFDKKGKVEVKINSSFDDVNEDGVGEFSASDRRLWLGTGRSKEASFAGLRFANVGVPAGAKIISASIEGFSDRFQWRRCRLLASGILSPNPLPFSQANLPSVQTLTRANTKRSCNIIFPWFGRRYYNFAQVTSIVQELVDQSGWEAGNSMGFVMKGIGDALKRKYIVSFDGNPMRAPRLVIRYR